MQTEAYSKPRIEWLGVLQGFSMLLVVLGHVTLTNTFQDPSTPLIATMERAIYSFHMPLFIFISGWLFCHTCIDRDLPYRGMIKKKLHRLGLPFLFFTCVTMVIKLALPHLMKRTVDLNEIIDTFLLFRSNPLEEMWFVITLLVLMSAYPIYKWLLRNGYLLWGLLAVIIIFFISPRDFNYYQLGKVAIMLPYFVAGILCCHYGIIEKYASNWWVLFMSAIIFVCSNVLQLADRWINSDVVLIINACTGIIFSICICAAITSFRPQTFSSFSRYTFQIFLLGIFFQMAIRVIYGKIGEMSPWVYPALFATSVIAGVYIPVVISKFIKRYCPKIKALFGL